MWRWGWVSSRRCSTRRKKNRVRLKLRERRAAMKPLSNVQLGTLGGTLGSVWNSFDMGTMLQTAVLAAVGATVCYLVSKLLEGRRRPRRSVAIPFLCLLLFSKKLSEQVFGGSFI